MVRGYEPIAAQRTIKGHPYRPTITPSQTYETITLSLEEALQRGLISKADYDKEIRKAQNEAISKIKVPQEIIDLGPKAVDIYATIYIRYIRGEITLDQANEKLQISFQQERTYVGTPAQKIPEDIIKLGPAVVSKYTELVEKVQSGKITEDEANAQWRAISSQAIYEQNKNKSYIIGPGYGKQTVTIPAYITDLGLSNLYRTTLAEMTAGNITEQKANEIINAAVSKKITNMGQNEQITFISKYPELRDSKINQALTSAETWVNNFLRGTISTTGETGAGLFIGSFDVNTSKSSTGQYELGTGAIYLKLNELKKAYNAPYDPNHPEYHGQADWQAWKAAIKAEMVQLSTVLKFQQQDLFSYILNRPVVAYGTAYGATKALSFLPKFVQTGANLVGLGVTTYQGTQAVLSGKGKNFLFGMAPWIVGGAAAGSTLGQKYKITTKDIIGEKSVSIQPYKFRIYGREFLKGTTYSIFESQPLTGTTGNRSIVSYTPSMRNLVPYTYTKPYTPPVSGEVPFILKTSTATFSTTKPTIKPLTPSSGKYPGASNIKFNNLTRTTSPSGIQYYKPIVPTSALTPSTGKYPGPSNITFKNLQLTKTKLGIEYYKPITPSKVLTPSTGTYPKKDLFGNLELTRAGEIEYYKPKNLRTELTPSTGKYPGASNITFKNLELTKTKGGIEYYKPKTTTKVLTPSTKIKQEMFPNLEKITTKGGIEYFRPKVKTKVLTPSSGIKTGKLRPSSILWQPEYGMRNPNALSTNVLPKPILYVRPGKLIIWEPELSFMAPEQIDFGIPAEEPIVIITWKKRIFTVKDLYEAGVLSEPKGETISGGSRQQYILKKVVSTINTSITKTETEAQKIENYLNKNKKLLTEEQELELKSAQDLLDEYKTDLMQYLKRNQSELNQLIMNQYQESRKEYVSASNFMINKPYISQKIKQISTPKLNFKKIKKQTPFITSAFKFSPSQKQSQLQLTAQFQFQKTQQLQKEKLKMPIFEFEKKTKKKKRKFKFPKQAYRQRTWNIQPFSPKRMPATSQAPLSNKVSIKQPTNKKIKIRSVF